MPIASKLIYFQRRPSPAPPDPGPEPPDPRRRPYRDDRRRRGSFSSSHHKPDLVSGHQRDAASKSPVPAGTTTEPVASGMGSGARLHHSVSDHGRLPDAVQQARERLLQRLSSVDLSGRRQKTRPSETLWAGAGRLTRPTDIAGVSTSYSDIILASLTNCFQFQPCEPVIVAASKVGERPGEHVGADAGDLTPATAALSPEPARPEAVEDAEDGAVATTEAASPAECAICLERCGGPDADGGGAVVRLPCTHVFHSACLDRWLRSRADCPYCRAAVLRS